MVPIPGTFESGRSAPATKTRPPRSDESETYRVTSRKTTKPTAAASARDRVERQQGPEAGRDPLAPPEPQVDREVVPQDRRQGDHDTPSAGTSRPVAAATSRGNPSVGSNPLSRSSSEDEQEEAEPEDPADVGRADVARADRADVDPPDPA